MAFASRRVMPVVEPRLDQVRLQPLDRRAEIAMRPGGMEVHEEQIGHVDALREHQHHRNEDAASHHDVFHEVGARAGDPVERLGGMVDRVKAPHETTSCGKRDESSTGPDPRPGHASRNCTSQGSLPPFRDERKVQYRCELCGWQQDQEGRDLDRQMRGQEIHDVVQPFACERRSAADRRARGPRSAKR